MGDIGGGQGSVPAFQQLIDGRLDAFESAGGGRLVIHLLIINALVTIFSVYGLIPRLPSCGL
jgi:hypothetical protein